MPSNISFLNLKDYGWQECDQINAPCAAVLLTTRLVRMHDYLIQSFVFSIVRNLYLRSLVETQCDQLDGGRFW